MCSTNSRPKTAARAPKSSNNTAAARGRRPAAPVRLIHATPAPRPLGAILRDVARAVYAEGARLADGGPREVIAETMTSLAAGRVTWRQIVDTATACAGLAELATHGAERTGEDSTHRAYPLAHGRAYARCALELLDAVAARFGLPDGFSPVPADGDGLYGLDLDAAGLAVDLDAAVSP